MLQQNGDEREVGVEIKSLYDELLHVGERVEIEDLKVKMKDEDCNQVKLYVDTEDAVKQELSDSNSFVDVVNQKRKGF